MVDPVNAADTPHILSLHDVSRAYGSLRAVDQVSMTVDTGACHAIIGPNGAGKSTLFKLVSGRTELSGGRIIFSGQDISRVSESVRNRLGIATTFQQSTLFDESSVHDNLMLAVQRRLGLGRKLWVRSRDRNLIEAETTAALERYRLTQIARSEAGSLSHGERRRVEIALALCTDPTMLLLDEPAAGMSPAECDELVSLLKTMECTVVLIEHNIDLVLDVATHVSVLDAGTLIFDGHPEEVSSSSVVKEAYLGEAE